MKTVILLSTLMLSNLIIHAQTTRWEYDASHANVGFNVSHFGISETKGKFAKFDGVVLSDESDFSDSKINFRIDVSSIDTGDAKRDSHLMSADFFDVAKFPAIKFIGRSLKASGKNTYKMLGELTMHGIKKEIILDVIYRGTVVDPFSNTKAGFKISGVVDRKEFGLTWNGKLATGETLVSDEVTLDINVELLKSKI